MDNLTKIKKQQAVERLLKTRRPKSPAPMSNPKIVEEAFRVFAHQASEAGSDSKFLEDLRKLTGHDSVEEMVRRFRKLAGIC